MVLGSRSKHNQAERPPAKQATPTLSVPAIPVVSNVTGELMTAEQAQDPDYWVAHLRGTVRFHAGLRQLGDSELRDLTSAIADGRHRHAAALSAAGDQALGQLPRMIRIPLRKLLG